MAPVLGYWNIRGLAQPIRLMLKYAEVEFEDKLYEYGPKPDYSREAWLKEKETLGLDFPNLPYYIDEEFKLTQSVAIMRYLALKYKLDLESGTPEEKGKMYLLEQQISDLRSIFARMAYQPDFAMCKEDYLKKIPDVLKGFSEALGKQKWLVSDKEITYVDFMMYEVLDQHHLFSTKLFDTNCLDEFQNLKDFVKRFEGLPNIEKYMKSEAFIKFPLNGDMAFFGSRSHPF